MESEAYIKGWNQAHHGEPLVLECVDKSLHAAYANGYADYGQVEDCEDYESWLHTCLNLG